MRILGFCIVAMLALSGCSRKKASSSSTSTNASKFAMTPIPVAPAKADTVPAAQSIASATSEIDAAQAQVLQVLTVAQSNPAATAAVPPLENANRHLTAAKQHTTAGSEQIKEIADRVEASEKAHLQAEETLRKDVARLQAACAKDSAQASKAIESLEKENADLKDETMRSARHRLMWMGIILIIGGAGSIAAFFFLGFVAGPKLAPILVLCGAFLITLSQILPTIVFYTEIACGIGALVLVAWIMWHLFHHDPASTKRRRANAETQTLS